MPASTLEERAAEVLRSAPEAVVPLERLHRVLLREVGPQVGGYAQLHERLRRRSDLFLVLEPRAPWTSEAWPPEVRAEYQAALRATGLDAGPHVALVDGTPPADSPTAGWEPVLRRLDQSLLRLWSAVPSDGAAAAELSEALAEAGALRHAMSRYLVASS